MILRLQNMHINGTINGNRGVINRRRITDEIESSL